MTDSVYVSLEGDDAHSGDLKHPLKTLDQALSVCRSEGKTHVLVHGGIYYLDKPLTLGHRDSGISFQAFPNEHPVISGGVPLHLHWSPFRNGIYQAQVPDGFSTDQLFVNGVAQPLARYPNFDPNAKVFNGVSADAISPDRVKRWGSPQGGFIHALHAYEWGDVHYRITGKDADGALTMEGGWQNNRPAGMRKDSLFVEGIFEELDSPGEWFLDHAKGTIYYYPPTGMDLERAQFEGVRLSTLVKLEGTREAPVRNVSFKGFILQRSARTFMENREPLLRSDWTIFRGGAIFASGTQHCHIDECFLDAPGGNAIFISGYNRNFAVKSCRIENAGANGVAFVGDPSSVRNPLFNYDQRQSYRDLDLTPGPKGEDFPSDCLIEDCLIDRTGRIEKQSAGVEISMSRRITVRQCSIYDMPRAGINIGDGCWGGHLIEGCDVFDTVKETGDHGSFNSWGRDRYWALKDVDLNLLDQDKKGFLPLLDAVEPIILRHNRWRCDHGWDIDLDDGSSNFRIVDNLCLHGGLKLREGFHRVCENNVIVDNSFHFHVWFKDSQDVIERNIVGAPYQVIEVAKPFGEICDFNLLGSQNPPLSTQSGRDLHSKVGAPDFVATEIGDYRVKPDSPAIALGFRNFSTDRFGVTDPDLKRMARTPELPGHGVVREVTASGMTTEWMGGRLTVISDLGERSAVGLGYESGLIVSELPKSSKGALAGLKRRDVILSLDGKPIRNLADFASALKMIKTGDRFEIIVLRDQKEIPLEFSHFQPD